MSEAAQSSDHAREGELDARAVDRLVFFSDAVIAIIITLMVLEVRLPQLSEHASDGDVRRALLALWPKYFAVMLSFLVIGLFWTLHHRRFNWVRRLDGSTVWLNLLFLLAMACIPFASAVLAEHGGRTPTILYAAVLATVSFLAMLLWQSASRRSEVAGNPAAYKEMRVAVLMSITSIGLFLGSIIVAFFSTAAAQLCWLLVFLANRIAHGIYLRNRATVPPA